MADLSESVCLNHPDTPAAARCATCGKPVCSQCLVTRNGSDYCSERCADNAENSEERVNNVLENKKKVDSKLRIRAIVLLILLIAAAAAAYYFYQHNKNDVDRFIRKTENKVSSGARDAKNSIQKSIPSDSAYKKNRENLVK